MKTTLIIYSYFILGYDNSQYQSPYPQQPTPYASGGMYPNYQGPPNYGVSDSSLSLVFENYRETFAGLHTVFFIPAARVLSARATVNITC